MAFPSRITFNSRGQVRLVSTLWSLRRCSSSSSSKCNSFHNIDLKGKMYWGTLFWKSLSWPHSVSRFWTCSACLKRVVNTWLCAHYKGGYINISIFIIKYFGNWSVRCFEREHICPHLKMNLVLRDNEKITFWLFCFLFFFSFLKKKQIPIGCLENI